MRLIVFSVIILFLGYTSAFFGIPEDIKGTLMGIFSASKSTISNLYTDISDTLKRDFYNIYNGIALETRYIINESVTIDKLTFHMYRRHCCPQDAVLDFRNIKLLKKTKGQIVFIIHGWASSASDWVLELKDAFLNTYPKNTVITMDWTEPASQPYYVASINTDDVGNMLGELILYLVNHYRIKISKFLLVGHSLGAQVCGFAAKRIKEERKLLPRIVGLDPAGPLFDIRPLDKRLNEYDAKVVEIVHSDRGRFGYLWSCGTIDFYPNGGNVQPGCATIDLFDPFSVSDLIVCDHQRAYRYFIEAVQNPGAFLSMKCWEWSFLEKTCNDSDVENLGNLKTEKTGSYYFETNKERPYSKDLEISLGLLDRIYNYLYSK